MTVNFSNSKVSNAPNSGPYAQKYFNRTFIQGVDCFHLDNDNIGIKKYVDSLWDDYGKLFGILIANQLRVGQVRAKISIPVTSKIDDNERIKLQQQYATTLYEKMMNDPIVFIPADDKSKSSYDEISSRKSATLQNQITDFWSLKKVFIGEVAGLLGIPPALVLGETANNSENLDLAIESAAIPLGNKLSEGFASILIKKSGYSVGNTLQMTGFKTVNILDRADAIATVLSIIGVSVVGGLSFLIKLLKDSIMTPINHSIDTLNVTIKGLREDLNESIETQTNGMMQRQVLINPLINLNVPFIPTTISFAITVIVANIDSGEHEMELSIKSKEGSKIIFSTGKTQISAPNGTDNFVANVDLRNIAVREAGEYVIFLNLDGAPNEDSFYVVNLDQK